MKDIFEITVLTVLVVGLIFIYAFALQWCVNQIFGLNSPFLPFLCLVILFKEFKK